MKLKVLVGALTLTAAAIGTAASAQTPAATDIGDASPVRALPGFSEHYATPAWAKLKEWRAVATRYEKTATSFLGVLCLSAVVQ